MKCRPVAIGTRGPGAEERGGVGMQKPGEAAIGRRADILNKAGFKPE